MNFWKNLHPLIKRELDPNGYDSANYAVLQALATTLTDAETETIESKIQLSLGTATGEFLSDWGSWFGIPRKVGETDEDYRTRIKRYMFMKRGTIPAIIDAIRYYLKDQEANIQVYEPWTDMFMLDRLHSTLDGKTHLSGNYYRYAIMDITMDRPFPAGLADVIRAFKPAGVYFYVSIDTRANPNNVPICISDYVGEEYEQIKEWFGYNTDVRAKITLGDQTANSGFQNLFITDQSRLDGLDVLGGSFNANRTYWGLVATSDNWIGDKLKSDYSTDDLIQVATELDPDVYRNTGEVDGSYGVIDVPAGTGYKYIYFDIDVAQYVNTYYRNLSAGADKVSRTIDFLNKANSVILRANMTASLPVPTTAASSLSLYLNSNNWINLASANIGATPWSYSRAFQSNLTNALSTTGYVLLALKVAKQSQPYKLYLNQMIFDIHTISDVAPGAGVYTLADYWRTDAEDPSNLFRYATVSPGRISSDGTFTDQQDSVRKETTSAPILVSANKAYTVTGSTYSVPNSGVNNVDSSVFSFYNAQGKLLAYDRNESNKVDPATGVASDNYSDYSAAFNRELFMASGGYSNLINTVTTGNLSSGVVAATSGFKVTDYVPITPTDSYLYRQWGNKVASPVINIAYYDSAKTFIRQTVETPDTYGALNTAYVKLDATMPTNAAYVRFASNVNQESALVKITSYVNDTASNMANTNFADSLDKPVTLAGSSNVTLPFDGATQAVTGVLTTPMAISLFDGVNTTTQASFTGGVSVIGTKVGTTPEITVTMSAVDLFKILVPNASLLLKQSDDTKLIAMGLNLMSSLALTTSLGNSSVIPRLTVKNQQTGVYDPIDANGNVSRKNLTKDYFTADGYLTFKVTGQPVTGEATGEVALYSSHLNETVDGENKKPFLANEGLLDNTNHTLGGGDNLTQWTEIVYDVTGLAGRTVRIDSMNQTFRVATSENDGAASALGRWVGPNADYQWQLDPGTNQLRIFVASAIGDNVKAPSVYVIAEAAQPEVIRLLSANIQGSVRADALLPVVTTVNKQGTFTFKTQVSSNKYQFVTAFDIKVTKNPAGFIATQQTSGNYLGSLDFDLTSTAGPIKDGKYIDLSEMEVGKSYHYSFVNPITNFTDTDVAFPMAIINGNNTQVEISNPKVSRGNYEIDLDADTYAKGKVPNLTGLAYVRVSTRTYGGYGYEIYEVSGVTHVTTNLLEGVELIKAGLDFQPRVAYEDSILAATELPKFMLDDSKLDADAGLSGLPLDTYRTELIKVDPSTVYDFDVSDFRFLLNQYDADHLGVTSSRWAGAAATPFVFKTNINTEFIALAFSDIDTISKFKQIGSPVLTKR